MIQIRCVLANFQSQPTPTDLSRSTIILAALLYHVELPDVIAMHLHYRSLQTNDAWKASKGTIRIQCELYIHEAANIEFKSAFSWNAKALRMVTGDAVEISADVITSQT